MFRRRLIILSHYLRYPERYLYATVGDVLRDVFAPTSAMLAYRQLEHVQVRDEYLVCYLRGLNRPLYWPRSIAKRWLYQVISEAFYARDPHYYEIPETQVRSGDTVVDCGAAEGLFSLRVLGRAKRCYLIEPSSRFQRALALTFAEVSDVEVVPMALGAVSGSLRFTEDSIMSAMSETGALTVTVETLDHLFYEQGIRVDYLKMDLEGAEMNVLVGAEQTIRKFRPRIAVTLYHVGQNADETVTYLQSLVPEYRYRLKGICAETGNPVMGHFWTE